MLELQRHAGNRAVTALVSRAPAPPAVAAPPVAAPPAVAAPPVLATFRPVADFATMTLGAFNTYANDQADWASDPALPPARRQSLISVLEFARDGTPSPVGPCGAMPVADLEASGLTPAVRSGLRTYSRGVASTDSAAIPNTAVIADALRDGDALGRLEAAIPRPALHQIMGTADEGKAQFPALVTATAVDSFVDYYRRAHPYLEAENGFDVVSYLAMMKGDGVDPASFVGRLPHVHNYHRFLPGMLDTLIANEAITDRAKPLLLILHTGSDHNGAFHRDAELMNTVQHPRNLAIMVEGADSLDALGDEAGRIARRQGQGHRIEQLMLAGHGSMRGMDLTGHPDATGGSFARGGLDLDHNRARTERFLRRLVGNMATGPNAHIVLNACLTAADEVNANLSANPAVAKGQILASLAAKPNLARRLAQLAPGRSVEGNVSSVAAGSYMALDAAGNPTGVLHQQIPTDPFATSTDRGDYIEHGVEPEGAVRALVALWAVDKAEALARVALRRAQPITDWGDRVIHTIYDLMAASPDHIEFINRIANHGSRGLSEFSLVDEQTPGGIGGINNSFSGAEEDQIFNPLYGFLPATGQLAMDQVWMIQVPARRATFLTVLDGFATTLAASAHLAEGWLAPSMPALLPAAAAAAPSSAQIKLALWAATGDRADATAIAFLRAGALASHHIAVPGGTTVDGLTGGAAAEDDVLRTIGLLGPQAPDAAVPNVDTDGDGVNDFYVQSITREAMVTATWLNVRTRPSLAAARLDVIPAGTELYVFGRSGGWFAIEHSPGAGFVHSSWVRPRPVA